MKVSEWIKASRKAVGKTQEQLADVLGCTRANVSQWEMGKHEASLAQILAIYRLSARALPIPGLENETALPQKDARWLFTTPLEKFEALPPTERHKVDSYMAFVIVQWEKRQLKKALIKREVTVDFVGDPFDERKQRLAKKKKSS